MMHFYIKVILLFITISSAYPASKKHFTDKQIANMIPNYFNREHNAPNINRIRVYAKDNEKYLHIEIDVNRNRYQGEVDFTLYALANISQYAKIPFDQFVIVLHPAIKSQDIELVKADAPCTIDYLIHKSKTEKRWSETCLKISTDFENFVVPDSHTSSKIENSKDDFNSYLIFICMFATIAFVFYLIRKK